ncbi:MULTISPECIES: aspartate kinase [Bacillota]|jgi:aspartate kinase|uniref:Aspartokinase n=2 Tax=Amedibacillus TaxID=2749846 RepID=A0A7G9GT11_9FIRM|nr:MULTISPECIES: aspartate kinase [Bacillota]QNM13943.1 aspartate kinase [[Eubacterium] hominis]MCH4283976.1 aspartate kinase [Amedibacillus hominis]RGB56854.1 aspartate kinase [Absiella sp. AM22-9]RGB60706.1 aspartate kinase [Absiella sp. AM10-20]RGB64290.1 aspartate kinase [Absiella sp. AM09-45]
MNVVEKYGGTSVGTIDQILAIAQHVKEMKEAGHNIVIVASAMGKTTNKLIEMTKAISDKVNQRELDSLLSTGEQRTITLLAMAIDALGIPAISLTGYQCGFITSHHHAHARIKDIDITNLKKHLDDGKVVVVAGFQGATENGEITTLGRGGSDTTAVALAAKLGWECHIYTDVNGVYTIDPRLYPHAKRLKEITYNEMMQMACLGSGVLETRSVELASKYHVKLFLGKALEKDKRKGTYIMETIKNLEDMPITGISIKDDYAIMRVNELPNDGKFLGELFAMIAKLDINLDTISQQLTHDGKVNFSFYCNKQQSDTILEHLDELHSKYPISRLLGFVKLSVVGVGISTHSGIAAKVLNTLSAHGIRYYMITSSEISISLTIEEKDKQKAIQVLGEAFDL